MRMSIGKTLAACVVSMVLASAIGCDEGKSPPRTVQDNQQTTPTGKPGEERR